MSRFTMNLPNAFRCVIIFVLCSAVQFVPQSKAISCYTCSSWNFTDKDCHDPYNPAHSKYTQDCMVPKPGHIGQFPANFCLKIIGKKESTGEELVIRQCIMEHMDNQCGVFKFQDITFQGCILTCDFNGCNIGIGRFSATHARPILMFSALVSFVIVVTVAF